MRPAPPPPTHTHCTPRTHPAHTRVLKTSGGKTVSLASFKGKPLVLFFYPKAATPGCTKEVGRGRGRRGREEAGAGEGAWVGGEAGAGERRGAYGRERVGRGWYVQLTAINGSRECTQRYDAHPKSPTTHVCHVLHPPPPVTPLTHPHTPGATPHTPATPRCASSVTSMRPLSRRALWCLASAATPRRRTRHSPRRSACPLSC
jgi:hypothetical protein